jgi:hypothetical protein
MIFSRGQGRDNLCVFRSSSYKKRLLQKGLSFPYTGLDKNIHPELIFGVNDSGENL